jgi:hypothetical protein
MNGTIYVSNVTVTLTATDANSGVDYTTYKLDNNEWTTYTEPFVVSDNGEHTVSFYSVDNAGNIEIEKNRTFTIQHLAPPSISITIRGGIGVSAIIKNTGTTGLTNINWSIGLKGGILLIGKTPKTGSIATLGAGAETTVRDFVFGFGKTTIIVTAGTQVKNATARMFLFFVVGVK